MLTPALIASKIVKSLRSSCSFRRSRTGLSSSGAAFSVSREISQPRTAFMIPISKLGAMAMTSPVAFIWVPS